MGDTENKNSVPEAEATVPPKDDGKKDESAQNPDSQGTASPSGTENADADQADDEEEEEGSSKVSNIIALVFVIGLIAFNVYAFWGYKDYGMPEVSPDKPQPAQVSVDGSGTSGVTSAPVPGSEGVSAVPGATEAQDKLGASGLSAPQVKEASPTAGEKADKGTNTSIANEPVPAKPSAVPGAGSGVAPMPTAGKPQPIANASGALPTAVASLAPPPGAKPAPITTPSIAQASPDPKLMAPPPGKRPKPIFATPTPGASGSPSADKDSLVAPPPGNRPKPIFATPTPGTSGGVSSGKDSMVAPPPGKRPEPVFSKFNKMSGSADAVMLPGPQFLIGVTELCKDPALGLNDSQRRKFSSVLSQLAADQSAIAVAAENTLSYLTAEQVKWIADNRGPFDVGEQEVEAGFDPITTAYLRLLRSKKDDGSKLTLTKYNNSELNFQDVMSGILKLEAAKSPLAINGAQAKALMPILVAANQARQSEAIHFQQLHEVLTDKQVAWLKAHPEKTTMDVNDIVLKYTQAVCK